MNYKNKLQKGLTWFLAMLVLSIIYLNPALAHSDRYGNWHMGRWMMFYVSIFLNNQRFSYLNSYTIYCGLGY
jgi:hypothetical protein